MALQKCPSCKEIGLSWHMDEEVSLDTIWVCLRCKYTCTEIELSRTSDCNHNLSASVMVDDNSKYYYCFKCGTKREIS